MVQHASLVGTGCAREPYFGRDECGGEGMRELQERVLAQRDELLGTLPPDSAAAVVDIGRLHSLTIVEILLH